MRRPKYGGFAALETYSNKVEQGEGNLRFSEELVCWFTVLSIRYPGF